MGNLFYNINSSTYVAFCIAFIVDAPVLNASTVSVVALAPSNIIICETNYQHKMQKKLNNLTHCLNLLLYTKLHAHLVMNTQLEITKLLNLLFI